MNLRAALTLLLVLPLGTAPATALPPLPAHTEAQETSFDHEHAAWTAILAKHVRGDTFDYAALAKSRKGFDAYLASLASVTPEELARWTESQRYAFWINAYNAFTVEKIVDNLPLESIRKLDGWLGLSSVFDDEFIPLKAHHPEKKRDELSLNDIEHGILRPRFEDARVHAAVNCASASCPPLRAEAFVADRLEKQLDEQMRAFVRDTTRNRLDKGKKRLRLSSIFKWFQEDFVRDGKSLRGYLKLWLPESEHAFVDSAKIEYLDYDWDLNAPKKK